MSSYLIDVMKKFFITLFSIGVLFCHAQEKALVSDFIFFNTLEGPETANIPEILKEVDRITKLKKVISDLVKETQEVDQVSFRNDNLKIEVSQSGFNPIRSFKSDLKKLAKAGGYSKYVQVNNLYVFRIPSGFSKLL